jgi:hypothetical protein
MVIVSRGYFLMNLIGENSQTIHPGVTQNVILLFSIKSNNKFNRID